MLNALFAQSTCQKLRLSVVCLSYDQPVRGPYKVVIGAQNGIALVAIAQRGLLASGGQPRAKPRGGFEIDFLREKLAIPVGLEPTTHSLEGCCSIQLSYGILTRRENRETAGDYGCICRIPAPFTAGFAIAKPVMNKPDAISLYCAYFR